MGVYACRFPQRYGGIVMETTKQKFTIEIVRPTMDAKVTEQEIYEIIGVGLKCFGWDVKVMED